MKNTIDVYVSFDFKGQHHEPELHLDLDELMATTGRLPALLPLIARHNNIDAYSYEYEMMEAEDVRVRRATGLAAGFVQDGRLDMAAFEQHWLEQQTLAALTDIASRTLDIEDLSQQPALKEALLAAYRLGRSADR